LLLALALLAAASPGAGALADTKSELTAARARLSALQADIASGQAAAAKLLQRSTEVAARLAAQRVAYARTEAQIAGIRADMAKAEAAVAALRDQLDRRAAATYVGGPGSTLEALLGSSSMADFSSRLEFVNQVAESDAALVLEITGAEDTLRREADRLADFRASQRRALDQLQSQDRTVRELFAKQQRVLAGLAAARSEAATLAQKLGKQLHAEELAAARAAAFGGGSMTFGQWAGSFLPRIGAPACHDNMVAVVAWGVAEYTAARWNPLATSYPMPGATDFTAGGVKNYRSLDQGLDATRLTLERGSASLGYGPILQSLRGCRGAEDTARAVDASSWCRCGAYVEARIPAVEGYYDHYANLTSPAT
jgi:peptidoglycan hydrolase CwlO-like protein